MRYNCFLDFIRGSATSRRV